MQPEFICATCGSRGAATMKTKGSLLIELILWCCFVIPGLIYSVWRRVGKPRVCDACGGMTVVPLNTPVGQKLAAEHASAPATSLGETSRRLMWGRVVLAVFVFFVVLGVIVAVSNADHADATPPAIATSSSVVTGASENHAAADGSLHNGAIAPPESVAVQHLSPDKSAIVATTAATRSESGIKELMQKPTECGNQPYLAHVADNYRAACDITARMLQAAIRKSGAECDYVTSVNPAIEHTPVSEVFCVVPGASAGPGMVTNIAEYMITDGQVKRMPDDVQASEAMVNFAVAHATETGQTGY